MIIITVRIIIIVTIILIIIIIIVTIIIIMTMIIIVIQSEFLILLPGVQLMVAAGFSLQDESTENGKEDNDSPGLILVFDFIIHFINGPYFKFLSIILFYQIYAN